mmetsp:Transcript_9680/g.10946  ORF Transcript_9680/g.10946 Transcript_9680/m.10946 type:complete len:147 (+) Transcript_9680:29-469(+)
MPSFFIAIKYIPMSQANIVLSISPLITAVVAYFILSEILHIRNIIALVGAFVGVFFINISKAENKVHPMEEDKQTLGMILTFVCLTFHATVGISNRFLVKHVHTVYSPFYFSLGMFLCAFGLILFFRDNLNFEYYDRTTICLFSGS